MLSAATSTPTVVAECHSIAKPGTAPTLFHPCPKMCDPRLYVAEQGDETG